MSGEQIDVTPVPTPEEKEAIRRALEAVGLGNFGTTSRRPHRPASAESTRITAANSAMTPVPNVSAGVSQGFAAVQSDGAVCMVAQKPNMRNTMIQPSAKAPIASSR